MLVRPCSADARRDGLGCTPGTLRVYMHGLRRKTGLRIRSVGGGHEDCGYVLDE